MIPIYFMESEQPLTKTIAKKEDGTFETSAYPNAYKFKSHKEVIKSPEEFYNALVVHALQDRALLKGVLKRDLDWEPRAGSTDADTPTRWICLDIDGLDTISTAEQFITAVLPEEFHNVTYIMQWSSRQGIAEDRGMGAHIFFMLSREMNPPQLRAWLTHHNLTNDTLVKELNLNRTGLALKYKLDVSTCQNDKLLYISPPTCIGFKEPLKANRYQFIKKSSDTVTYPFTAQMSDIQGLNDAIVADIRKQRGLPKRNPKYRTHSGEDVLSNPDRGSVTGYSIRREFVHMNLNGGDSWGYFIFKDSPEVVRNFKGEPPFLLKNFDKTFYSKIKQELMGTAGLMPFAFRDRASDRYYNGVYDKSEGTHELHKTGSKEKIRDFFGNYGVDMPEPLPDWSVLFEPDKNWSMDTENKRINLYQKTPYIKQAELNEASTEMPPICHRILWSVAGSDQDAYDRLFNWIAFVIRHRRQPLTSYIVHGVEGTGKGVLFSKILAPIIGRDYCKNIKLSALEENYNSWMVDSILIMIDEASTADLKNPTKVESSLRTYITDSPQSIREMYRDPYQADVYAAFLITSNMQQVVPITDSDRRFHVAPRQEEKLIIDEPEINLIEDELQDFANHIYAHKLDYDQVRTVDANAAKELLRKATANSSRNVLEAIKDGNIDFFLPYYSMDTGADALSSGKLKETLKRWIDNDSVFVTQGELMQVYGVIQGARIAPNKFTKMLEVNNLSMDTVVKDDKLATGVQVKWYTSKPDIIEQVRSLTA